MTGKVSEKNDLFHVLTVKVTIFNQNEEKVLRGTMQIGVMKDGEE